VDWWNARVSICTNIFLDELADNQGEGSERAGIEKSSRGAGCPIFCPPAQKLLVLKHQQKSYELYMGRKDHFKDFESIESWLQYSHPSSKVFARPPINVIPKTWRAIGTETTMIAIFFTERKLIILDVLPKWRNSTDYILSITFFPIWKGKTWIFIVRSRRRLLGFGMLKRVLKDRDFHSSDRIEEMITKVWDGPTFDEVQSVFHNWMNRFAWII
jgi:hypothetical protein